MTQPASVRSADNRKLKTDNRSVLCAIALLITLYVQVRENHRGDSPSGELRAPTTVD